MSGDRGKSNGNAPARTPSGILLEMRNVHIEGQSDDVWHPIVKGISLTLRRGEVLGLIGESGAGKSTLGLAAMGYARGGCRISQGEVLFDGVDLLQLSEAERQAYRGARISYVAQSAAASFNPAHRLIDQFCEIPTEHGLMSRAGAEREAIALYRSLLMPDPERIGWRYPHQVSGGQLQRAMTAMAVSCKPDLIIFDEPTTALDVTTQIEVLATIKNIVRQFGTAAIYITHDLAVVAQMADRIMVLRYGNLMEEAPTRQMLSAPQNPYTKSLWAVRSHRRDQKAAAGPGEQAVVHMDHVSAAYGPMPVLFNVSFQIHKGRTVAVVGESGSGKSTCARVITGLLPASKGRILYKGEVLPPSYKSRTREQLRRVQMIYQMPDVSLNPKHTVRDTIGRPLEFYLGLSGRETERRIASLLEQIELEPDQYIDRLPGELSGGQKQRVCIARALAAEPEFIICDEVTSALDQLVAEGILKLLDRLQKELDLSYMFITHDLATVKAIADEVVVMQHGKVVEAGPKDEMFRPPHHEYTELLLSSVPEMDPDWLDRTISKKRLASAGN